VRDVAYRENVAREILQTEKDYVNNLMLLMSVFINPIKESLTDNVWKPKNGSKLGEVPLALGPRSFRFGTHLNLCAVCACACVRACACVCAIFR
jgi:hypothetical protein